MGNHSVKEFYSINNETLFSNLMKLHFPKTYFYLKKKYLKVFDRAVVSFISSYDNFEQILSKILSLFPEEDLESDKILFTNTHLSITEFKNAKKQEMRYVRLTVKKKLLFDYLLNIFFKLPVGSINLIENNFSSMIDELNHLYLRFDLEEFFLNDKFILVNHGNCLHIKLHIQTYPCSKSLAKKYFSDFLDDLRNYKAKVIDYL